MKALPPVSDTRFDLATAPAAPGWRLSLLAVLFNCLLAFGLLHGSTVGQRVDLWLQDGVIRALYPAPHISTDALVLEIDETSLQSLQPVLGSWPFSREVYAIMLDYLFEHGADAVLIDLLFADPREGDQALAAAMARHPRTVLVGAALSAGRVEERRRPQLDRSLTALSWAASGDTAASAELPARQVEQLQLPTAQLVDQLAAGQLGLISVSLDVDGLLRRFPLLYQIDAHYLPAAALQLLHPGRLPQSFRSEAQQLQLGKQRWQVDQEGRIGLRYPPEEVLPQRISFGELMMAALGDRAVNFEPRILQGRTILLGNTALLGEHVNTPVGGLSGVDLLALLWSALKLGNWQVSAALPWQLAITVLGALPLLCAAARPRRWSQRCGYEVVCSALVLLLIFAVHGLALHAHWQLALGAPLLAWLLSVLLLGFHHWRSRWVMRHELMHAELADHKRVVAMVSHELKTPLASIDLALQNLAREQNLPVEVSVRHQRIRRASKTLLRLIEENLVADRLQGKGLKRERFLLSSLLARVLNASELSGILIDNQVTKERRLEADQEMLAIALGNVLANAGKYAAGHGPIKLRCTEEDGWLSLCVIDQGPGIPPGQLAHLFEPYSRLPGARSGGVAGTGLGLALVQQIVVRHGGRVSVDSVEGEGSCFCLHLPVYSAER